MNIVGIICEYNPFHNGHLKHIEEIKKLYPDSLIICVMSGHFTQRGNVSVLNKWEKTKLALTYGVNIVVELPFVFASHSADIFAKASIELLDELHCDTLVFGSECNDINLLSYMAETQVYNKKYQKTIKKYMETGTNYPTACSKALFELTGKKITTPNDILGITYIREILLSESNIKPVCIKRNTDYHSKTLTPSITSATSIRYSLSKGEDITPYVPSKVKITHPHLDQDYFSFLKYKIATSKNLSIYQTVDEGIENRILKYINYSKNIDELILKVKTKRYTYNKLMRMFTHILCDFTKEEAKKFTNNEYIRILGFNPKGQEYLNKIKKVLNLPLITTFSTFSNPMLEIEKRVTAVYTSPFNEKDKVKLCEAEYKEGPIIY